MITDISEESFVCCLLFEYGRRVMETESGAVQMALEGSALRQKWER
jgi:hypothetical protein